MTDDVDVLNEDRNLFAKLDRDRFDGGWANPFSMVGAMLKSPGALYRDLGEGRWVGRYLSSLAIVTVLLSVPYGAILGMAGSSMQALYAAVKLPMILLGSVLLCLPTFYVFNALFGSRISFWQAASAVLFIATGASIILIAFAPVAWLFTVSTPQDGWRFLVLLHLAFALTAAYFGIRFLRVGGHYLTVRKDQGIVIHAGLLKGWCLLLLVVAFQMTYTLRPIMTEGPFLTGERGSFVTYVGEFFTLSGGNDGRLDSTMLMPE